MRRFEGRVALVTGASGGVGRAVAIQFAKEGAKVSICSRREKEGQETLEMIKRVGGEGLFVQCDVAKSERVKIFFQKTTEVFGKIDYAVNNAAIIGPSLSMIDYPEEEWDHIININLKGTWLCMKYEIPVMLKNRYGAIVNLSSVVGLVGDSVGAGPYTATKHGVIGLTKSAALEFAKKGIRINAICPGFIETPMIQLLIDNAEDPTQVRRQLEMAQPVDRMAAPEEIAAVAVWLCSDEASYLTGAAIPVDGGCTAQ